MLIEIASSDGSFQPSSHLSLPRLFTGSMGAKNPSLILCNHFPYAFEESPKLRRARMATPLFDDIGVMILHIRQSHQCRLSFWFLAMA